MDGQVPFACSSDALLFKTRGASDPDRFDMIEQRDPPRVAQTGG